MHFVYLARKDKYMEKNEELHSQLQCIRNGEIEKFFKIIEDKK